MGGDMVSVSGRQQKISLQIGGPKEEDQKENDWARRQYLIWEGSLALAMFFFLIWLTLVYGKKYIKPLPNPNPNPISNCLVYCLSRGCGDGRADMIGVADG